jgi:hypothetical protein
MRILNFFLVAALALANGNTPYPVIGWGSSDVTAGYGGFNGPYTVFAGYPTFYSLQVHWAVDITCASSGNTCDSGSGGYQPTGSETLSLWNVGTLNGVGLVTSGTMPLSSVNPCGNGTSVCSVFGGAVAYYHTCNISGTTFTVYEGSNCSGTQQTWTTSGTGQLSLLMDQPGHAYITSVSGYPTGTTVSYMEYSNGGLLQTAPTTSGVPYFQYSNDLIYVQLNVPANATPASYTLSFTVNSASNGSGTGSTFTFPINVVALTPISTNQDPSSYPAIPGLSTWQTCMTGTGCPSSTGGGAYWAANLPSLGGGCDLTECYYDGIRVNENIFKNTGNTAFALATSGYFFQFYNVESPYGVLPQSGAQPGYNIFPDGLALYAARTGDTRGYSGLQAFINGNGNVNGGGGYVKAGGLIDTTYVRETAYALKVYNVLENAGFPRIYWKGGAVPLQFGPCSGCIDLPEHTATLLIEQLTEDVDGTNARVLGKQPFMDGLAMEALIQRWQITHDPRIPYVVKREIDDLYANWYNNLSGAGHTLFYNTGLMNGPACSLVSRWFGTFNSGWCGTTSAGQTGDACNGCAAKVLNNLFAPAFAWYWRICGGCGSYQTEGDDLFSHAIDNSTSSGKEFSQLYRWSFDYVRWRSGH